MSPIIPFCCRQSTFENALCVLTYSKLQIMNANIRATTSENVHYCIKSSVHVINSRALTDEKPCINKAIHALLMHGYALSICSYQGHRIAAVMK